MSLLGVAARSFITEPLAEAANTAARRGLMLGLLWVATLFVLLLVLGFSSVAVYFVLAENLSPPGSALVVAGILSLVAAAVAWFAWRRTTSDRAPPAPAIKPPDAHAELLAMVLGVGLAAGEAFFQGRKGR